MNIFSLFGPNNSIALLDENAKKFRIMMKQKILYNLMIFYLEFSKWISGLILNLLQKN